MYLLYFEQQTFQNWKASFYAYFKNIMKTVMQFFASQCVAELVWTISRRLNKSIFFMHPNLSGSDNNQVHGT